MAELDATGAKMDAAWRILGQRWNALHSNWNDKPRRDFENDYWLPLEKQVSATQDEMKRLGELMSRARRAIESLTLD